jgi:CRP-like cAMP-binding protein
MHAGDFLGEMALLTDEKRNATIISTTPVFLGEITKADILPLLKRHPQMLQTMSEVLARRMIQREVEKGQSVDEDARFAEIIDKISQTFKGTDTQASDT